jgi:dihydroorotate dehydrogenase (fumarate)
MMTSELLAHGTDRLRQMRRGIESWMAEQGYRSVEQLTGSLSQHAISEPAAYERAHYVRALNSLDFRLPANLRTSSPGNRPPGG